MLTVVQVDRVEDAEKMLLGQVVDARFKGGNAGKMANVGPFSPKTLCHGSVYWTLNNPRRLACWQRSQTLTKSSIDYDSNTV